MTKEIAAILALGPKGILGKKDKLAWHSSVDFDYFKKKTVGWPCIFGATTFYGLPKYPLKNRLNIVLDINNPGVFIKTTQDDGSWIETSKVENAINLGKHYDKIFICGGKSIYEYVIKNNLVNTIYLTEVKSEKLEKEAENNLKDYITLNLDLSNDWVCSNIEYPKLQKDELEVKFIKYRKLPNN